MAPLELGSQLARESLPGLGVVLSDNPFRNRGSTLLYRLEGGILKINIGA
jgi:hypothetical protein